MLLTIVFSQQKIQRRRRTEGKLLCYLKLRTRNHFMKIQRFEAAVLGMREVLGTQEYSPEQLFTYAKENKITEERWASFLADAFTNGVPSLSEVTTTRL
eukprot:m.57581 g.57581  ORF g.57581 m.57581 type:complete len:99 (+) comp11118_c0_seq1:2574-2870(+)